MTVTARLVVSPRHPRSRAGLTAVTSPPRWPRSRPRLGYARAAGADALDRDAAIVDGAGSAQRTSGSTSRSPTLAAPGEGRRIAAVPLVPEGVAAARALHANRARLQALDAATVAGAVDLMLDAYDRRQLLRGTETD